MKVIEKGAGPQPYRFTCKSCESKLEAGPGDVNRWNDLRGSAAIIKCPVCGTENWIDASLLKGWR